MWQKRAPSEGWLGSVLEIRGAQDKAATPTKEPSGQLLVSEDETSWTPPSWALSNCGGTSTYTALLERLYLSAGLETTAYTVSLV